jgi:inosose dehydratase
MRLAFSRPTETEAEQRELFSSFRSVGFEGLQLKAGQYGGYLDDPKRFWEDWGSEPTTGSALIFGGRLDEPGIQQLLRVIAFARAVQSERVVFCHALSRSGLTPGDLRGFARILSGLGNEAQSAGVGLSLHHHYDQPVMHRDDFDCFFEAVDEGAVGLTLDTAHLVKSGVKDAAELIRAFAPVIDNVHLKDFAAGEFRVLGEGEGEIDFSPVFQALRAIGYGDWLCADEESGGDLRAGLTASFQFIQTLLASPETAGGGSRRSAPAPPSGGGRR